MNGSSLRHNIFFGYQAHSRQIAFRGLRYTRSEHSTDMWLKRRPQKPQVIKKTRFAGIGAIVVKSFVGKSTIAAASTAATTGIAINGTIFFLRSVITCCFRPF